MTDILGLPNRSGPATHALVVGVSHYRHFQDGASPTPQGRAWDMEQLSAAAGSAGAVAEWLATVYHNPDAPLQTLRVLLSPQHGEAVPRGIAAKTSSGPHRATMANFKRALGEFKRDCDSCPDNVGFVYMAGHGVQITKHDAILLLEDIGSSEHVNPFEGAVDATGCHSGMNHAATAATQFWFIDACRQKPAIADQFESMTGAFTLLEMPGAAASSPLFLASSTREAAFARIGRRTLFCEALLDALSGHAAVGPGDLCRSWHVSSLSLNEKLTTMVRKLAQDGGEEQNIDPGGRMTPSVVHRFEEPPPVRLSLTLHPEAAARVTKAALKLDGDIPVPGIPTTWPVVVDVAAGIYLLEVTTEPPFRGRSKIMDLAPPKHDFDVGVEP